MYKEMDVVELMDKEEDATKLIHPVTGQTFCEIAAEHLALGVKRNPRDMQRVKRIAGYYLGPPDARWSLPEALLLHFPDDKDFKDIANGEDMPPQPRDERAYIDEMHSVLKRTGPRLDHHLYYAERRAGQIPVPDGDDDNTAEVHLREERIDALAELVSLFAVPDVYAACPVQHDPPAA